MGSLLRRTIRKARLCTRLCTRPPPNSIAKPNSCDKSTATECRWSEWQDLNLRPPRPERGQTHKRSGFIGNLDHALRRLFTFGCTISVAFLSRECPPPHWQLAGNRGDDGHRPARMSQPSSLRSPPPPKPKRPTGRAMSQRCAARYAAPRPRQARQLFAPTGKPYRSLTGSPFHSTIALFANRRSAQRRR